MAQSKQAAKQPEQETVKVRFPYEIVRWTRSTARKTGTTEILVEIDADDFVVNNGVAKLKPGAEICVSGYKRDGKTRGMRAKHTVSYTAPLAAKPEASDDE